MLLYTTCKPFRGHDAVIQRNALRSWARLPDVRVLVVGSDEGTKEMVAEIGAMHRPYEGVPLVKDLWQIAREAALPDEVLCYANADIILRPEIVGAANAAAAWQREFLLVGQRYSLQVYDELDFDGDWMGQLQTWFTNEGSLGVQCMVDYFIWRGDFWGEIPGFYIGRYQWDDWLVWRALTADVFVCDVTEVVPAYHQGHRQLPWEHPQAQHNRVASGGNPGAAINDAHWRLTKSGFTHK